MALVKFIRGNRPQDLTGLDANTLYFFEDTKEIFKGAVRYGVGDLTSVTGDIASLETAVNILNTWKNGTEDTDGAEARLQTVEQTLASKAGNWDSAYETVHNNSGTWDRIADTVDEKESTWDAKVSEITAADNTVTIGTSGTTRTVGVKLNSASDNAIQVTDTGLKVELPPQKDYTVRVSTLGDDAENFQIYQIKQGPEDGEQQVVGTINIPRDLVVRSGEVVTLNATDEKGHEPGTYIRLLLQNTDDEIWISASDLVDVVTSGSNASTDQIVVAVNPGQNNATEITARLNKPIEKNQLASGVQDSLDLADSAMQSIAAGSVTKTMLESGVQSTLDKADSALQKSDISDGTANGTIIVKDKVVNVGGLGTAAYTDASAYATAAQGALAATALQASDIVTGGANGSIAVNGTDVAVKGLGSAAFTDSTAYATAAQGQNADDAYAALTWQTLS